MKTPDLPSLNALRAFEATARLASVSRAAAELHVTHGAISRQIKLLEAEIGTALLAREGRGVRPTAAGLRLCEAAGSAFDRVRLALRDIQRDTHPDTLVLGCPGSLLARWVIPRLERLAGELPGLRLHLSPHEDGFDPNLSGLDAALLIGNAPWPQGWQVHELAGERIGPVLSPRHPAFTALSAQPPSALLEETLLHTASRPQAWPLWAACNGLDPQLLRMGTGFEHLYYLLEGAVAGLGIAIAPQQLVAEDITSGRLAAPWGFVETGAHWCLCSREDSQDTRLGALAGWLERELGAFPE